MSGTSQMFLFQASLRPEAIAALIKDPQPRADQVGRAVCEAVGGTCRWAGYTQGGRHNVIMIAELPNQQAAAAIQATLQAGGSIKESQTIQLFTAPEYVEILKQAQQVSKNYQPQSGVRNHSSI